jgi:hypothetical protein
MLVRDKRGDIKEERRLFDLNAKRDDDFVA